MTARARVVRGLVSGLLHEVVVVILSFAAMIVLVRLLTPAEYGQAAVAIGVTGFIGAFRGAMFVEHALQHAKDEEPDWDTYFALVGVIQMTLFGGALAVSFAAQAFEAFAPIAPLLFVAAFGFLIEWPAQVGSVKLRRELRFDRLKLISSITVLLKLTSMVLLAWLGFGAMALVISGNVVSAVPMSLSFLLVERWRPRGRWMVVPEATTIRPIFRFGSQQIAMGLAQSLRTAAESVVLTKMFGTATFGLINRAHGLYQSTVGRLSLVFVDTAYPLLPMERTDNKRYAHRASRFIEAALVLSIPGAAFIAIEGTAVSRLLYGDKWIAADPFLAPAAIAVAATGLVSAAGCVVMGMGHMRSTVIVETGAAIGGLLALIGAVLSGATEYLWGLAGTQILAALVAFKLAAPFLDSDWRRRGLWPAAIAATAGSAGVVGLRWGLGLEGVSALVVAAIAFGSLAALVLAVTARPLVREVLRTRKSLTWSGEPVAGSQAPA